MTHPSLATPLPRRRNPFKCLAKKRKRQDQPDGPQSCCCGIGPSGRYARTHRLHGEPGRQTANSGCDKGRSNAGGPVKNVSKCHFTA